LRAYAILLDSRPDYLRDACRPASLLLAPLGPATVLQYLSGCVSSVGSRELTIAAAFEPEPDYERRIRDSGVRVDAIVPARALAARIADYEPSDWLMLVDPRCFPATGLEPRALLFDEDRHAQSVRHLVALDAHPAGTTECVQFDANGTVRRIQRYYDSATWRFSSGVACSLLPVSCILGASELSFASLRDLRRSLAELGVPSRDVPIDGGAFDLSQERDLLGLSERVVLEHFSRRRPTDDGWIEVGAGCQIHPSARLMGPVVLQDGAVIGAGATVVGPAVIGAGARIECDAMVAQCVVGPGEVVASGVTVRHRTVFGAMSEARPAPTPAPLCGAADVPLIDSPDERDGRQRSSAVYLRLKSVVDVTAAALGLLVLSPCLLLTAVLIKLESKGPVFFRDRREGKGGRVFECLKFRTMFVGAEAQQRELMARNQLDGPQFKLDHDPRVTSLGRTLRRLSVDELPQLINVLFLEMSLVGPRPSPFRENQTCIPWREGRLSVRPGITGLWQVCRHDRSQADFHQWIQFDLLYVRHMSFLVDLNILVATILTLGGQWPVPFSWIVSPRQQEERR
jgi:lipopolysaccharide/colanic/teichoic acid biosynthesis glycosyltransferase